MYGPLRHGYGGLRDYCIGVRFVTGDGRKAKGGGRVVKNVAGYDMMKLFIGSQGTLGVITGASFKLFPAPRQTRTFVADFPHRGGGDRIPRPGTALSAGAHLSGDCFSRSAGTAGAAGPGEVQDRGPSWFAPPAVMRC